MVQTQDLLVRLPGQCEVMQSLGGFQVFDRRGQSRQGEPHGHEGRYVRGGWEVAAARCKGILGASCGHRHWGRLGKTFLGPVWRVRVSGSQASYLHLPEDHPLVPATRCQLLRVRAETDCLHTPLVTCEVAQQGLKGNPGLAGWLPVPSSPLTL